MATPAPTRQPRGIPAGGQFAATTRPPAGISLLEDGPYEDWDEAASDVTQMTARRAPWANPDELEDLAQDAWVDMLSRRAMPTKRFEVNNAIGLTVTRAKYSHDRTGDLYALAADGTTDRQGWAQLNRMVDSLDNVGLDALDAAAQHIRDRWEDPRHKPRADFHQVARHAGRQPQESDFAPVPSAEQAVLSAPPVEGQWARAALDAAEQDDGRSKNLERAAFNAIAEARGDGTPLVKECSLSQRKATRCRALVGTTDSEVRAAIEKWEQGELDEETTGALFAAFGSLDEAGRAKVAEALTRVPGQAGYLYASTIMCANVRRPR